MKLARIFTDEKTGNGLYSVIYNGKKDEYSKIFKNWDDSEYVDEYIYQNRKYLESEFFRYLSRDKIISRIHEESYLLQQLLRNYSISKNGVYGQNLKDIFKPLNNYTTIAYPKYEKLKAYLSPPKGILRVYGIRADTNVFVVTGGAIKLTQTMQDHPDTNEELIKLESVKVFLTKNHFCCEDDFLNVFTNES